MPDPCADGAGLAPAQQCAGNIHISFVHGNLFEAVGDGEEHIAHDRLGDFAVVPYVDRQEHRIGAELPCACRWHGRIDAVSARLVVCCGYHGSRAGTDHDGFALQFWLACHFQRGVERIHVDMQHGASGLVMAPVAFGRRQPWCSAHIFMVRAVARIVEHLFECRSVAVRSAGYLAGCCAVCRQRRPHCGHGSTGRRRWKCNVRAQRLTKRFHHERFGTKKRVPESLRKPYPRSEGDSNPRAANAANTLAGCPFRPLRHHSGASLRRNITLLYTTYASQPAEISQIGEIPHISQSCWRVERRFEYPSGSATLIRRDM